jgi:hypothetical protein
MSDLNMVHTTGLDEFKRRLTELLNSQANDIFHINYEFGSLQFLLRIDLTKPKPSIMFNDLFGRPMPQNMHDAIRAVLGSEFKIVDVPKLERSIHSPNTNVAVGNSDWLQDSLAKFDLLKDAPATPAPLTISDEEPVNNIAKSYASPVKKHYGIFVEGHQVTMNQLKNADSDASVHFKKR